MVREGDLGFVVDGDGRLQELREVLVRLLDAAHDLDRGLELVRADHDLLVREERRVPQAEDGVGGCLSALSRTKYH